jgi:AcrR family transcriptional regulator
VVEPAPRTRQARADRTRAHIIEIAALAFAEHGFDGVSLNELVRSSKVSKGAFYFHFASKDELALACFRAKQEELVARVLADDFPASAAERVVHLLERRTRLIREDPSLGCVTRLGSELNVRSGPGSTYASFQDLALTLIADFIRDGQRSDEFRADLDPDAAARAIFASIVGIDVLSLLISGGSDLEARTDELTDLILRGLVQRPPDSIGPPADRRRPSH